MKVSNQQAAMQAIQNFMSQQVGQTQQTQQLDKPSPIKNLISQAIQNLMGQVSNPMPQMPVMRYGVRPPTDPNNPPVTIKYGIIPPDPGQKPPEKPPVVLRYGILPQPPSRQID